MSSIVIEIVISALAIVFVLGLLFMAIIMYVENQRERNTQEENVQEESIQEPKILDALKNPGKVCEVYRTQPASLASDVRLWYNKMSYSYLNIGPAAVQILRQFLQDLPAQLDLEYDYGVGYIVQFRYACLSFLQEAVVVADKDINVKHADTLRRDKPIAAELKSYIVGCYERRSQSLDNVRAFIELFNPVRTLFLENSIAAASRSGDSSILAYAMSVKDIKDVYLADIKNHRDVAVLNQHFEDFKQGVEQDCNQLRPH